MTPLEQINFYINCLEISSIFTEDKHMKQKEKKSCFKGALLVLFFLLVYYISLLLSPLRECQSTFVDTYVGH